MDRDIGLRRTNRIRSFFPSSILRLVNSSPFFFSHVERQTSDGIDAIRALNRPWKKIVTENRKGRFPYVCSTVGKVATMLIANEIILIDTSHRRIKRTLALETFYFRKNYPREIDLEFKFEFVITNEIKLNRKYLVVFS